MRHLNRLLGVYEMLKLQGILIGSGTRSGERKVRQDGTFYDTDARHIVCIGGGDGKLPEFYNCENESVMTQIASAVKPGQPVELLAGRGRYGVIVTGFAPAVRAS